MTDARCANAGMVVGTDVWLPEDPAERFVAEPDLIGCNRLFCSACKSWVRHLDDVRFTTDGEPPRAELEPLYVDARAAKYRGFRQGWLGFRVYLCRCSCVEIAGVKQTGWLDHADGWSCAGHPPPPGVVEPVVPPPPDTEAEVEAMLRSSASGPPMAGELEPWDFALRWPQPFIFRKLWPVITRLLLDPDETIRTRALEVVGAWRAGDATTLPRLLELARKHASLYQGGLRTRLAATLSNKAVSIDSYRVTIAQAIVTLLAGAPPPRGAETLLAEYEPDAVIRSAGKWTASDEDQSAAAGAAGSMALYRRDHLLALLAELATRSAPAREEILEEVSGPLAVPDDKLRLILAVDAIPPPQTQPALADCRRALGLTAP